MEPAELQGVQAGGGGPGAVSCACSHRVPQSQTVLVFNECQAGLKQFILKQSWEALC